MNAIPIPDAFEQADERDDGAAFETAREAALEEFEAWQRGDFGRREFEDFGNWLVNKASWNRPNAYEGALNWHERRLAPRLTDASLHSIAAGQLRFVRSAR